MRHRFWLSVFAWLAASPSFAAPAITEYAKVPAAGIVRVSPSGDRYAVSLTKDGRSQVLVQSSGIATPTVIDGGNDEVIGVNWAGDDHLVISVARLVKLDSNFTKPEARVVQTMVFNLKTGAEFEVFKQHDNEVGAITEGIFGFREINGKWYGYFGGFTKARALTALRVSNIRDLYRVDLDTGDIKLISSGSDNDDDWAISPDGQVAAHYQYEWQSGEWRVSTGPDGKRTIASGQSKFGGGLVALGAHPGEILFGRPPEAEGLLSYQLLSPQGGQPVPVDGSDMIRSRFTDPTTGLWVGFEKFGEKPKTRLFPAELQGKMDSVVKAFPGRSVFLESWDAKFAKVAVFVSGGPDSGSHYLIDLTTHKAEPLAYAYEGIEPTDVGPVRVIHYSSADGLPLDAVLTLPPGRPAQALPLIVLPNGGVGGHSYPIFNWKAQAFASLGYAVIQPNTRGSVGYGNEMYKAGFGELGRRIQTDISDAVAEVAKQGIADSRKVCIVGSGWGGYQAIAGVTLQTGIYRCAVSEEGIFDLPKLIAEAKQRSQSVNAQSRYLHQVALGMSIDQRDLEAISPLRLAKNADAPVLLIYTHDSFLYNVAQNQSMADALRRAGKTVEVIDLPPGAGQENVQTRRVLALNAIISFVQKHNPAPPPTAAAPRP